MWLILKFEKRKHLNQTIFTENLHTYEVGKLLKTFLPEAIQSIQKQFVKTQGHWWVFMDVSWSKHIQSLEVVYTMVFWVTEFRKHTSCILLWITTTSSE